MSGQHQGDLRSVLIRSAISLLREKGPSAFSMREVARIAGVSNAAPYRYFKDRSDFLVAVVKTGFVRLAAEIARVEASFSDDPKQQLIEASLAYVELAVNSPEIGPLIFGGYLDPARWPQPLSEAVDEAFSGFERIVEKGKEAGIYRDNETRDIALAAWSLAHGLVMMISSGQLHELAMDRKRICQVTIMLENLLLEGLLEKNAVNDQ